MGVNEGKGGRKGGRGNGPKEERMNGVVVVDGEKTKQETIDSFVWGKKEKNGWMQEKRRRNSIHSQFPRTF
jgi:hypothetical protein